jgi:hypothetical protein
VKFKTWQSGIALSLLGIFALIVGGCGQVDNKSDQAKEKDTKGKPSQSVQAKQDDKKEHDHSGWWCDEHGIPEGECSMCSAKVAAEFKKKNDWCEKHDRAKSQCFICNSVRKAFYAAMYKAKYGKEPPEPTDNQPPGKEEKQD